MIRFLLTPLERIVTTETTFQGPKYFPWRYSQTALVPDVLRTSETYGRQQTAIVAAELTDAQAATLAAQADVTLFSADLDTALGSRLQAMRTAIEALNIPGQSLTGTSTDRVVIRSIRGIFSIGQCMDPLGFDIFAPGVSMNTTIGSLPANVQSALDGCLRRSGFAAVADVTTGATTVRTLLSGIGDATGATAMLGVLV